jgi:hypothetical protein
MIKICTKCNKEKDINLFAKGGKYLDGRRSYCKQCHSNYVTEYVKNNPSKRSKQNPNRKFKRHGLDEEEYLALLNMHNGKCHSCKERDAINIDHDHSCCPGAYSCGACVRGLLCSQCNTSLGLLGDNLEKINNLIKYISKVHL